MSAALLPGMRYDNRFFWASSAVNLHTLHEVLFAQTSKCSSTDNVTLLALITGASSIKRDVESHFEDARKAGVLLHAWHGSSSLAAPVAEVVA